jgi:alkylation response protein AidB-like acyl-CoA dehydrogenase
MIEIDEFRAEAQEFLDDRTRPIDRSVGAWGEGPDTVGAFQVKTPEQDRAELEAARNWQRAKFDAGFGWICGPPGYGGRGLPPQYERAFQQLESEYVVPPQTMFGGSLGIVGPTILAHGPEWMKAEYLKPLHRSDVLGCQLLSEPEAGSDLAAVRTRAEVDGAEWRIDGQKVWNSKAKYADVGLLLARSDPDVAKHHGLTTFLLPMATNGVEVRPLRQMTGGADFNEVFFSGVRLPDRFRIGEPNEGWGVVRTALGNERAAIGAGGAGYGGAGLAGLAPPDRIVQMARHFGVERDPVCRQDLARLYSGYQIARYTALRTAAVVESGGVLGPWTATSKLHLSTHMNWAAGFIARLLGPRICADSGEWGTYAWKQLLLGVVGMRIGGGTDEILRNTIAEKVLGLPREPRVQERSAT